MKTIAEMQQEIRSIRKTMNQLDARLSALDEELLGYKNVVQEDSTYQKVFRIATAMPLIAHPITKCPQCIKSRYFSVLIMITTVADSMNLDQLLFLQRMILSDGEKNHIEDYANLANKLDPREVISHLGEEITVYRISLLLDMMILAALDTHKSDDAYAMIADVACLLHVPVDEVKKIAAISKMVLESRIPVDYDEDLLLHAEERFSHYLSEIPGWKETMGTLRKQKELKLTNIIKNKRDSAQKKTSDSGTKFNQIKQEQDRFWHDWYNNE